MAAQFERSLVLGKSPTSGARYLSRLRLTLYAMTVLPGSGMTIAGQYFIEGVEVNGEATVVAKLNKITKFCVSEDIKLAYIIAQGVIPIR